MSYINDKPDGEFLYIEIIKLSCIVCMQNLAVMKLTYVVTMLSVCWTLTANPTVANVLMTSVVMDTHVNLQIVSVCIQPLFVVVLPYNIQLQHSEDSDTSSAC